MALKSFLKNQIETYKKVNNIEIQLGRKISDNIFRTNYDKNFLDIIKEFLNYKLSAINLKHAYCFLFLIFGLSFLFF